MPELVYQSRPGQTRGHRPSLTQYRKKQVLQDNRAQRHVDSGLDLRQHKIFSSDVSYQRVPINSGVPIQRAIGPHRPLGTNVIDRKSKNIFVIVGYDEHKGYLLKHKAMQSHPFYVLPDDDRYNFFTEPDKSPAPENKEKSSGLLSSLGRIFASSSTASQMPQTTSSAYERGRGKEIAAAWPKITPRIQQIKTQAIELEQAKPGSVAFYNAAGLGAHTLHRLILAIYEELHNVRTMGHVFLRAPGNPPRAQASENPQTFLATRKEGVWSDHQETDSILSANISLSANVRDPGESSFGILQSGGLFDVSPDKTVQIIAKMLESMDVPDTYARAILIEVSQLAKTIEQIKTENRHSNKQESVLYQTFIPKPLISKLVYIAQTNGHPLDYQYSMLPPEKVLAGIAAAGRELGQSGMVSFAESHLSQYEKMSAKAKAALFHSAEFTHMVLDAAKSAAFWAHLGNERDPQARILMHPKVFAEPSGLTETITHSNLSERTSVMLEQGLSQVREATQHALRAKLLTRIHDSMMVYGAVYADFYPRWKEIEAMSTLQLQGELRKIHQIAAKVDQQVQAQVWDYIGAHPQLKPQLEAGLEVICRGRQMKFDIDVPAKMLPDEFNALLELLHQRSREPAKKPEVPDLLSFE